MVLQTQSVRLNMRDVALFVRTREGTQPELPPLILLHGWPASSRGWERVIRHMSAERTIVCPDLRGLGRSERAGTVANFAKQELAKDIAALINALGLDHFVIGGQDWGGTVAQEVALLLPERTRGLIVMNINLINNPKGNILGFQRQMASPKNPRWYMAFQAAPELAEAMIPGKEDLWVRYFFKEGAGKNPSIPSDLIEGYIEDYRREGTARTGANYYRAMPLDAARWATLGQTRFTQPSLLLYGDQDPFLTPEFYDGYAACFEDITRIDLPGGHFIQDERPEDVASAIDQFLTGL